MRTHLFLLFLLILTSCHENCSGQIISTHPGIQNGYKDWFIGDFRCGVYIPPSYDPARKYPLVVYLHGKSDTVTRNIGWYHEPAALADPAIVLSPKCPLSQTGEWGNSWTNEDPPMIKKTFEMIDRIRQQYRVDEDRLYIYGISMGAIGTFGLIQKYPDLFAGGYAVCGWGNPEMAPQLSKVPFWIFHGEDDDVVPVQGSRGIYKAVLTRGGKQIRYTEFKGVKHDAWNHLNDNQIIRWLLAQKKGSVHRSPDQVAAFRGKANSDKGVVLEWNKPATGSDLWYFKVYRNNQVIAELNYDRVSYTDSLVDKHTAYAYQIAAVNYHFQESSLSPAVRISPSQQ
jgi:poly(3-hydroxybutyrate) depolymerase